MLVKSRFEILKGKKVGLITNPTGVNRDLQSSTDLLFNAPDVMLTALYGPEHGVRGEFTAGEIIGSSTDPITGLPVYSLYGNTRKPINYGRGKMFSHYVMNHVLICSIRFVVRIW